MIKKLFESVKLYWGYAMTVMAIAAAVVARDARMQKKAVETYSSEVKQVSYEAKIDKLIVSDSLQSIALQEIKEGQGEILGKQDEQKNAYNALRATVLDHIAKDKSMTIDQFKEYLESTPELKKSFTYQPDISIKNVKPIK